MSLSKQRRLTRQISVDVCSRAPAGFACPEEMFLWPDASHKLLSSFKPTKVQQLVALADLGGVDVFSYMAGKGTCGSAVTHINRCVKKHGVIPAGHDDPFACAQANDSTTLCCEVLCSMASGPQKI